MKKNLYTKSSMSVDAINAEISWQKVCPYCEAKYWDEDGTLVGTQILNKKIAQDLVNKFKSKFSKIKSFFTGANGNIPFYNGHPDHSSADARDINVYAEADDLEAREDGLWAHIIRHEKLEVLKNELGRREISPRWCCAINEDGSMIPTELISFGLVEKGNLPNADVINSYQTKAYSEAEKNAFAEIIEIMGLEPETATIEAVKEAILNLKTAASELENNSKTAETRYQELANSCAGKDEEIKTLKNEVEQFKKEKSENEKNGKASTLDKLFDDGRITIEQKETLAKLLNDNPEAFEEALEEILKKEEEPKDESLKLVEKAKDLENSAKSFWQVVGEFETEHNVSRIDAIRHVQYSDIFNSLKK